MASAARTRTAAGAAASTIKWAKVESWSAPAGSARGEDTPEALRFVVPSKPGGRHFLDETEIQ